jgi:hypothetical protein
MLLEQKILLHLLNKLLRLRLLVMPPLLLLLLLVVERLEGQVNLEFE